MIRRDRRTLFRQAASGPAGNRYVIRAPSGGYFVQWSPSKGLLLGSREEASGYGSAAEALFIISGYGKLYGSTVEER